LDFLWVQIIFISSKTNMKKRLIFGWGFLFFFISCTSYKLSAQIVSQPVTWRSKIVTFEKNIHEIQIVGAIDEDCGEWHIYDLGPYNDSLTPTSLTIEAIEGVVLIGKPYLLSKAMKSFDEILGMEIGICKDSIVVAQKIKVTSIDSVAFIAVIKWQACDNHSCLPPTWREFVIKLPGNRNYTSKSPESSVTK
jgi:thiol:disulfide interchange protein DsbD